MIEVNIKDKFIKIGQFLKVVHAISNGGEAKIFLLENDVKINNKKPEGRGSKVYIGDNVIINNKKFLVTNQ